MQKYWVNDITKTDTVSAPTQARLVEREKQAIIPEDAFNNGITQYGHLTWNCKVKESILEFFKCLSWN